MAPDGDKTRTFVPITKGTMVSHYRTIEKMGASGDLSPGKLAQ